MKKIFNKEVVIGLCVLVALAVLFFGINFLKGVNLFKATNYYYASFENVEGLAVSAPVTLNGYKVGQVRSIEYEYDNPGHVLVELALDDKLQVPQGSKAILSTDLLGTASIKLQLAAGTNHHDVGDKLIGEVESGMMDAVSNELMPSVTRIMPRIDTLLVNVNKLVADTALANSIHRLDAITADLATTSHNLAIVSSKLSPIAGDVKAITGNVNVMSQDLAVVSARLKEMPLDSLMASVQMTAEELNATMQNIHKLSVELNNPNSSLGRLISDPALYDNINHTVQSLDSLFTDIKEHPKRYISIKIF